MGVCVLVILCVVFAILILCGIDDDFGSFIVGTIGGIFDLIAFLVVGTWNILINTVVWIGQPRGKIKWYFFRQMWTNLGKYKIDEVWNEHNYNHNYDEKIEGSKKYIGGVEYRLLYWNKSDKCWNKLSTADDVEPLLVKLREKRFKHARNARKDKNRKKRAKRNKTIIKYP